MFKKKVPKDLGIVVKSKEEQLWSNVVEGYEKAIEEMEKQITVNKVFLEVSKKTLEEISKKKDL
jgi:hypothetical protein